VFTVEACDSAAMAVYVDVCSYWLWWYESRSNDITGRGASLSRGRFTLGVYPQTPHTSSHVTLFDKGISF
jgi:hypothetical protein